MLLQYKDSLVLMTSSSFSRRHELKLFYLKNLTKNSFNLQKILLLSLTKQFLDLYYWLKQKSISLKVRGTLYH